MELDDAYQLCTKTEYYGSLIRIVNHPKKPRLTDVMLETLSIIAYKQPVTKQEIEAIRGVKCDHPINKLLEYRLIKEAGRLDAIGRPILFRTTEEFLRCFGVKSTDSWRKITPLQVILMERESTVYGGFCCSPHLLPGRALKVRPLPILSIRAIWDNFVNGLLKPM